VRRVERGPSQGWASGEAACCWTKERKQAYDEQRGLSRVGKANGEARSGRTGARTKSKSVKIGSHALVNDWTTRFFCRGYFFIKQPMPKAYKAMDLSMLHLCAKGRLNSPNFQRRSKGRPKKKKTRETETNFQKSQTWWDRNPLYVDPGFGKVTALLAPWWLDPAWVRLVLLPSWCFADTFCHVQERLWRRRRVAMSK